MANLKEIRGRISSVKSTRKITSAMSRIAAARLRRAQNAMDAARQYGTRMAGIVGEVLSELDDPAGLHPLLDKGDGDRVAVVIVTSERGLCGGFNSGVNRAAERMIKGLRAEGRDVEIVTIGRKGRDYLRSYKSTALSHHAAPAKPDGVVDIARDASAELMALFQGKTIGGVRDTAPLVDDEDGGSSKGFAEIWVVYNHFTNVITQEVRSEVLLPVPMPEPVPGAGDDGERGDDSRGAAAVRAFEPDTRHLLDHLLPVAVETAIQQVLYNSAASEVAARRMAMDSATDNATELIGELTLQYNRERQAAITKELMEIIGGAEALKG